MKPISTEQIEVYDFHNEEGHRIMNLYLENTKNTQRTHKDLHINVHLKGVMYVDIEEVTEAKIDFFLFAILKQIAKGENLEFLKISDRHVLLYGLFKEKQFYNGNEDEYKRGKQHLKDAVEMLFKARADLARDLLIRRNR